MMNVRKILHAIYMAVYRPMRDDSYTHMRDIDPAFAIQDLPGKPGQKQLLWHGRLVKETSALHSIHNTMQGDCFIIGTGPSLNEVDLTLLKDKYCMGVNGAIEKFKQAGVKPFAYAVTTDAFFDTHQAMLRDILTSGTQCFFPCWGLSSLCRDMPDLIQKANVFLADGATQHYGVTRPSKLRQKFLFRKQPDFTMHPRLKKYRIGFSRDLGKGYFHCDNIVYVMLQIAYYFGFRRVFILGMDLDYSGPTPRFYEDKKNAAPNWVDKTFARSIVPSFEVVKSLRQKGEIEVYNLSVNSRLSKDILPKMTFTDALKYSESPSRVRAQSKVHTCNTKEWMPIDKDTYRQVYERYSGSFATHPRILNIIEELTGVDTAYYAKIKNEDITGAIPVWQNKYIAGDKSGIKGLRLNRIIDLGNPEIILPFDDQEIFDLPYQADFISPLHAKQISNLVERDPEYFLGLYKSQNAFSSKTKSRLRRELRYFHQADGQTKNINSFTPTEIADIYRELFRKRWRHKPKANRHLEWVLSKLHTYLHGDILFINQAPVAIQINYRMDTHKYLTVDYINGGVDPQFKQLSIGTVLLFLNTLSAEKIAEENGQELRYSFGCMKNDTYKQRWCRPISVYQAGA